MWHTFWSALDDADVKSRIERDSLGVVKVNGIVRAGTWDEVPASSVIDKIDWHGGAWEARDGTWRALPSKTIRCVLLAVESRNGDKIDVVEVEKSETHLQKKARTDADGPDDGLGARHILEQFDTLCESAMVPEHFVVKRMTALPLENYVKIAQMDYEQSLRRDASDAGALRRTIVMQQLVDELVAKWPLEEVMVYRFRVE